MKTNHSPGKWVSRCRSMSDGSLVVMTADHSEICQIRARGERTWGAQDDTDKANAALIAAAPDLLAALEECITDDPGEACFNTGRKTRRLQAISDIARAAIAKARGEA